MKINESGRSMVEMLGVLAIIGVLSIGGLVGYVIAMRKHRANEIVQTASMLAIMAQTANNGMDCVQLSTSGLPQKPGGVDVDIVVEMLGGESSVHIQLADEELCDAILAISPTPMYECNDQTFGCNDD